MNQTEKRAKARRSVFSPANCTDGEFALWLKDQPVDALFRRCDRARALHLAEFNPKNNLRRAWSGLPLMPKELASRIVLRIAREVADAMDGKAKPPVRKIISDQLDADIYRLFAR